MGFFQRSYAVGYGETIRLLHSSYSIAFVLRQPISAVNRLLAEAIEHDEDKAILGLWASLYPYMMLGWHQFISYADYKAQLLTRPNRGSSKAPEEIEAEMDQIIAQYEARKAVKPVGDI